MLRYEFLTKPGSILSLGQVLRYLGLLKGADIDNTLIPSYDLNTQDIKQWGMLFHYNYKLRMRTHLLRLEDLGIDYW